MGKKRIKKVATEPSFAKSMIEKLLADATNNRMVAESSSMQSRDVYEQVKKQYETQEKNVYILRGFEMAFAKLLETLNPPQTPKLPENTQPPEE